MADFRNLDVTVTLKGEEWFAIMAKMLRKPLSPEGKLIASRGLTTLCEQVNKASDDMVKRSDYVRSNVLSILNSADEI